ncbi:hypothetical protein Ancab_038069 [Ancistrocladus abbreviatus]
MEDHALNKPQKVITESSEETSSKGNDSSKGPSKNSSEEWLENSVEESAMNEKSGRKQQHA